MIKKIKQWLKLLSLSNTNNWEMYGERDWNIEMEGYVSPRKFYKHKKHPYFITNAFIKKPLNITELVKMFLIDYKNKELIFGETFYKISE